MATEINNMQDYIGYIKCGEILKSPSSSYQNPIILKCFECESVHFQLESFIIHIQEHYHDLLQSPGQRIGTRSRNRCKKLEKQTKAEIIPAPRQRTSTRTKNSGKIQEMEVEDIFARENLEIKIEDTTITEMDPLVGVKKEIHDVKVNVKEEIQDMEDFENSKDAEHEDDFGEVSIESEDELQYSEDDEYRPDNHSDDFQADTDTDSDKDKSYKKRKNMVKKCSPFVETFMLSKENVKTLINAYKNQPNLWIKQCFHYGNREKRKKSFEQLTQDLNEKQKINLNMEQTKEILEHIILTHRNYLKALKKSQKKGIKERKGKTFWYYEHLEFLRPKEKIQLQTLDPEKPDLVPEQIIQIIDIYKDHPDLWNSNFIEYICSNKRQEAYNNMLKILEMKMNLKITRDVLEIYINNIHKYFSKEKRSKAKSTGGNESTKIDHYYKHMEFLYEHEGPFTCSECNTVHPKILYFKVHVSQHNGSIPFKCSKCGRELKSVFSYTSHAKRHYEDFDFPCTECEKSFTNQQELTLHLMLHTGSRPYCCEICGTSFRHSHKLKKHLERHGNNYTHVCHICSRGFYSKGKYKDHINSHLNIRPHICKVCGKAFIARNTLRVHAVTHDEARNHACQLCGKTFKLKIGVLQHMRSHGNIGTEDKSQSN